MATAESLRLKHLYRILQCLCWALSVLGCWNQFGYNRSALIFLAMLLIYQSSTLVLNIYSDVFPQLKKATFPAVFLDAVITGLFLQLVDFNYALSIGILISFSVAYLQPFNSMAVIAIFGLFTTLLTMHFFSFPSLPITGLIESVILTLLMCFFVIYIFLKHSFDRELVAKLEQQSTTNRDLNLRIFKISKYLSPVLRKSIIAGNQVHVTAQEKPLTIFFSDMQGFSQLSEQLSPEKLTWLINSYLTEMSEIVFRFGGTLDKVIGDSLMVFFGDPSSRGVKNDAVACVCMAISMNNAMEDLKKRWVAKGISNPPSLRIGINSGVCKVGNFGTENRLEYTVLGSTVNLASRLESIAGLDEIVLSKQTYKLVKDRVHCIRKSTTTINGCSDKVTLYKAASIYQNDNAHQPLQ